MRYLKLIIVCVSFFYHTLNAQVDSVYTGRPSGAPIKEKKFFKDSDFKENLVWGSNFQAWIGNTTYIFLSPSIGYTFFERLQVGVGGIYNYTNYRSSYGSYSQSIFGGHSYARYLIGENFFVQVQFDKLKQPNLFSSDPTDKIWVPYLLAGIGMKQPIGDKVSLSTSLFYNMRQNLLSIYPNGFALQFGLIGNF